MNDKERLEYNKRCALFIGGKQAKDTLPSIRKRLKENDYWVSKLGVASLITMKFSTDWTWIHTVIEKIEELGYLVVIQSNFCQIQEIGTKENDHKPCIIAIVYEETKKRAVVKAIELFLLSYEKINNARTKEGNINKD